jgi:dienelactone hydrolase
VWPRASARDLAAYENPRANAGVLCPMSQRIRLTLAVILIAACASASSSKRHAVAPPPVPHLWDALTPGPTAIGFKSLILRAQASEFHHGPQHYVQISIWYPSQPGSGNPMTFRDYLGLKATANSIDEPSPEALQAAVDEFTSRLTSAGVSQQTALSLVNSPMIARAKAVTKPNPVRSPIVYIAQGNGQLAADQAVLAEFIASHGYIVLTSPSVPAITGALTSDDQIGPRAEEQSDDIDRAVSDIGDWPNAVNLPVSVAGYDFGVDALALYAMHQPVNAFVSLDGTTSPNGIASLKSVPMFDPNRKLPPVLSLYENLDHPAPDLSFLKRSQLDVKTFTSMRHVHFTTIGFAAAVSSEVARATAAGPNVRTDVSAMAQSTVDFLDRIWAPVRAH